MAKSEINKTAKFKTDISNQDGKSKTTQNTENTSLTDNSQTYLQEFKRYRLLSEKVRDIIWMVRPNGQIIEVNQAAIETYGYSREELLQMNIRDLRDKSERQSVEKQLLQAAQSGIQFETIHIRKDGKTFPVEVNATSAEFENEQIIISVVRDITERKRFEDRLRDKFDELENIYRTAPIGLGLIDREFRFIRINKKLAEINGISPENHIGRSIHEIVPDIAEKAEASFRQIFETGLPLLNVEITGETAAQPGVERTWNESWYPLKDENGLTIAISIVCEEITERKKTEEKLRESEERYRTLFESIDEGFVIMQVIFNDDNKPINLLFEQANPAFFRLTGLPKKSVGKTALEFIPNLESIWFETYGQVALTGEAVHFEEEATSMSRWFEVYASRIGGEGSHRVAIIFNNITERKIEELNQKLLLRINELIRQTDDEDRLFADVAKLLGERLSATRCLFNEVDLKNNTIITRSEYRAEKDLPSFIGTVSCTQYSEITRVELEKGQIVIVEDTRTDKRTADRYEITYLPQRIGAYISFPLMRDGAWIKTLWISIAQPHQWREAEISLIKLVAERVWLAAEKLRSERHVRESEERFRIATDAAEMFSWESNLANNKIKWSENAAKIIGCPPEYLSDDRLQSHFFIPPEESERLVTEFKQLLKTGKNVYSTEFRSKDNRFWQSHGLIVRDLQGNPVKVIGVTQDITARKQNEEKIQTANYRFRIAEEAAQGFNYDWNLATGEITRSLSISRVLGYDREEIAKNWEAWAVLIHPDDINSASEQEAVKFLSSLKEDTFSAEYRVRHKNGKYLWLMERGLIIRNEEGFPHRVIGQTTDITERKKQEEKNRISEERYRALVEASAQFVWTMDAEGNGDSYRQWLAELTGKPPEELAGDNYLKFVHPDDRNNLQKLWQQIKNQTDPYEIEIRIAVRKNKYRHYNLRGVPLFKEDGTLREWIGTVRDITERKSAEESLREAEGFRRLLIENARDYAIVGISVEGIILSWNSGAENIFGYSEKEIIGQARDVLFTPEDRRENLPNKEIEFAAKEKNSAYERWHLRKDGSRFFASGVLHELKSNDGKLLGFVKIARDQTKTLAAEKAIRDHETLKKVVGALEEERRRIARDLHDELGQQLTALRLKLEHCRKIFSDNQISKEIDEVQAIAKNIDQGVDFIAWQFRPAALDDLGLYAALDKFVREWSNYSGVKAELLPSSLKNVRFSTEIETNIYRITQEALNNISKHAKADNAELLLEKRDNLIVLIIADDGIGFDPKSKNVFNKGIGLIGMQERASLIDGKLEIESALGEGTTIYVRVPQPSSSRR